MAFNDINGNLTDENGNYIYKNIELTPNVFADILVFLFNGKQFKRHVAIDMVAAYHVEHGGFSHRDKYIDTFKRVTKNSTISSHIKNVGYGTWTLEYNIKNQTIEILVTNESVKKTSFDIDEVLGEGESTVYVYYYDVYKRIAQSNNKHIWECKIGMTDRNAMERIFSQSATAYPEYPHVAMLIKSDNAKELETAIHSILKLRGRWINNSPGTEWFLTSPGEIKDLYKSIIENEIKN